MTNLPKLAPLDRALFIFQLSLNGIAAYVNAMQLPANQHDKETSKALERNARVIAQLGAIQSQEAQQQSADGSNRLKRRRPTTTAILNLVESTHRLGLPMAMILYNSALVMSLCYLDALISALIHHICQKHPECLPPDADPTEKLSELRKYGDLNEAIDGVIDREVDKILFRSVEYQLSYFEKNLKVDVHRSLISWGRIIEAVEKRNLIVHNGGFVNRRYLRNVDMTLLSESEQRVKEGDTVRITPHYFSQVLDEIILAGTVITHSCWRKWEKSSAESADRQLQQVLYGLCTDEQWPLAERLGFYAKGCNPVVKRTGMIMLVNYMQALKWQGKEDELKKEMDQIDWSTLSPRFKLAQCALNSDKEAFYRTLPSAIAVDHVSKRDLNEWPLLREFRNQRGYDRRVTSILRSLPK